MRILIAEDERDLNELIKKRLKNNGYSVDACFNGKEVFDYLLCAEYDACLLYTSYTDLRGRFYDGGDHLQGDRCDRTLLRIHGF